MARVKNNPLLRGITGKVGGLVFRQVGNETIVSAGEAPGSRTPLPGQQAKRLRMYQAQIYASAQMLDPAVKALYATGITATLTSARTVAIRDFLRAPEITAINLSAYHGQPGDLIYIHATDDFAVTAVHVRLLAADGQVSRSLRRTSARWPLAVYGSRSRSRYPSCAHRGSGIRPAR